VKKKLLILLAISVAATNLYAQQREEYEGEEEPEVKTIEVETLEREPLTKEEAIKKFDEAIKEEGAKKKIELLGEIIHKEHGAPESFYKIKN
jgi:hypothetical protein